jgi:hypothetical protein
MKKLVLITATIVASLGGGLAVRTADAACNAWGAAEYTPYANSTCTCGSAVGHAAYRPADASGEPGDGSARIYSGNNSTNDIRFYIRCYNDDGAHYTTAYSAWNSGTYVYRACYSPYLYPDRVACEIRP